MTLHVVVVVFVLISMFDLVQEKVNKSDTEWINSILLTGTLSDKLSAHVLLVQVALCSNS